MCSECESLFYLKVPSKFVKICYIIMFFLFTLNFAISAIKNYISGDLLLLSLFYIFFILVLGGLVFYFYDNCIKKTQKVYLAINNSEIIINKRHLSKSKMERVYIPKYGGGEISIFLKDGKKITINLNFIEESQRKKALDILSNYINA